jgi:diaminopimelate decarboxylase
MTDNKKHHPPMSHFTSKNGQLQVGGIPLRQLAARVGQTPFYAYDRQVIRRKVASLREHLPKGVKIHYAMKANPMPAVVQFLAPLVDGLDVASGRELRVALDTGTPPSEISIAGPGKNVTELTMAVAAGVTINVESERELDRIVTIAKSLELPANVAVRVNPDFALRSSGMKMGGGPQQFGIDAENVPAVLHEIGREPALRFQGFHIFTGSQNLSPDAIIRAHNSIFDLAKRLLADCPGSLNFLNIGGGFGIPYFPGDTELDLAPICANLKPLVEDFRRLQPESDVVIELGRYLVGESGIYVCEVTDKKKSRGETFLVTNGGLHHHLAASGNFGQIIRKNYPATVGTSSDGAPRELVNVVGPLCTPLDLLAAQMELPHAEVGDLVVVFQSGAYGFTASPQGFLSHAAPVEVLV